MSDMKMKLPADRMSLETSHPLLTTLHAANNGSEITFHLVKSSANLLLLVNSTSGDVILNKSALEHILPGRSSNATRMATKKSLIADVKTVSGKMSAVGGNDTAFTTFEIDVVPTVAQNCDLISQDLCFWHSVTYRIKEDSPPTVIGSLASSYLLQSCKGYAVNYTLIKGKPFATTTKHYQQMVDASLQAPRMLSSSPRMPRLILGS